MQFIPEKIRTTIETISPYITISKKLIPDVYYVKSPYKSSNTPPDESADWKIYDGSSLGSEIDAHFWFKFKISVPKSERGEFRLVANGARDGQWDAMNPQCTVFIDSDSAYQAFDATHTCTPVAEGDHSVAIYY